MLFRSERLFESQLSKRMRELLKESERHVSCRKSGENTLSINIQISIMSPVIFFLKTGLYLGVSLVAGEIFCQRKSEKLIVPQIFSSDL